MIDNDILMDFVEESSEILDSLNTLVDRLEKSHSEFPSELILEFCGKVDGIMGVAKTIELNQPHHPGLSRLGRVSELCKRLGTKIHERKLVSILPILTAFWADSIEVMQKLILSLNDDKKGAQIEEQFSLALQKRLEWLAKKMGIAVPQGPNDALAALNRNLQLEEWLKSLGL